MIDYINLQGRLLLKGIDLTLQWEHAGRAAQPVVVA